VKLNRKFVRAGLRAARPVFGSRRATVRRKRLLLESLTRLARAPKGTRFYRIQVAGISVLRVQPPQLHGECTLLYLHGGGYALGSAQGYRGMVAHLAAAAGMTALIPDYSRSPDARFPIALDEMGAVYAELIDTGLDPKTTVIVGDSAGGGLTLALAMAIRDRGVDAPAAIGLICPWADLAIDIDRTRRILRDPLIVPSMTAELAPHYAGAFDPQTPGISPVYGDMSGLPPIVMHTGADDPLSVDGDKIEAAFATADGVLEHRRFEGLWHDFHLQVSLLAEARNAVNEFGADLRRHVRNLSTTTESQHSHAEKVASR
jgi:epsilon-lactone hydrolase